MKSAHRATAGCGRPTLRGATARRLGTTLLATIALLLAAVSTAAAAPVWRVDPLATTTAAPGSTLQYVVQMTNDGEDSLDATVDPWTFTVTLPDGLTADSAFTTSFQSWDCSSVVPGMQTFTCTDTTDTLGRRQTTSLTVGVAVGGSASGVLTARFDVAGGGAASVSVVDPTTITPDLPGFGVDAFDGSVVTDTAGTPDTRAGGHPYAFTTSIDFNTVSNPLPLKGTPWPVEPVKDVLVDLPPGSFGNPTVLGECSLPQLANNADGSIAARPLCPASSQVGTTLVHVNLLSNGTTVGPIPVFNMVPPPDAPARFGFNVLGSIVVIDGQLRSGSDYGITATVRNISEGLAITGTTLTLWGVPADPVHTPERACPGQFAPTDAGALGPSCDAGVTPKAFWRNPTSCTGPLTTTLRTDSWSHPGEFDEASFVSHDLPGYPAAPEDQGAPRGMTGCDRVPFDPRLSIDPASKMAGQPTGLSVDLSLPQPDDPHSIATSDLRTAVVRLPLGVHLSASSMQGQQGCTPAQIGLHTMDDPTCPDGSKLGTVSIATPALPDPLQGSIYLAGPHDNPFDTLVALYMVARGSGVIVKQALRIDLDPVSGQLTTTLDNGPQTPFSNVHLEFKGGSRAPIANGRTCGTYTTEAQLTGWNGSTVATTSSFDISKDGNGAPCPGGKFTPSFRAGTESNSAGSPSPFNVRMTREDDDQELGRLTVDMPEGLLGYISRVALCGNAQADAGTCPDSSKIGSVATGAGAGPNPFYITNGRLYITGPYKGAPYGISVVVPAVAGPFNLGNVVVRGSIFVDKHTSRLRVVSEPLPTLLQGVSLLVRDVRVAIDRPGFFFNPTSCAEKNIGGTIGSAEGASAKVSDRYQASECRSLAFRPKMVMRVGGRGHTRRGQTSPFTTTLRMPSKDQANLRFVRVTLPTTINARLNTINDACTRTEFESDVRKCAHAIAGSATAVTPVLPDPLKGTVYFVKNGHPIPDLFVALRGPVAFDLIGRVSIPGGKHLATTFATVPDVPVRSFTLKLLGGSRTASTGAATNLCSARGRKAKAQVDYIGQNGKLLQVDQALKVGGCGKPRRHGRGR
ncbi:MAG TPA: hypothetical protein VKB03_09765 [Conexibacter sp.]|nr:hypothetical protein [Conexibacter sp.]